MKTNAALVRRLAGALAAVTVLGLSACGAVVDPAKPAPSGTGSDLPEEVVRAGKLVVATGNLKVPTHFLNPSGELVGFNIDVAAALGQRLGIKLELVVVPFDSVLAGVAARRYDTALYNVSDTAERRQAVDFVDYALSGSVLVAAKGNPKKLSTDTTSLCGQRVAVKAGQQEYRILDAESARCAPLAKPPIQLQTYQDAETMSQSLLSGRSDAMADGMTTTPYLVQQNSDKFELVGKLPTDSDPLGMPFAKGRPELLDAFAKAWRSLLDSGEYKRLAEKWSLTHLLPTEITINRGDPR